MKAYLIQPTGNFHWLQMLTRYKAWASDITLQSVSEIPEGELTKVRPTTFKTIIHTLNHIHVVDDIFRAHLERRKHDYSARNTEQSPPLHKLLQASQAMDRWYIAFADQHSQEDLTEIIDFEFVGGGKGSMSRAEILLHVVNHATYHIGYVSDMMYQVPVQPPASDLTVFLRDIWRHPGV